ncbi:MAG TPA: peptidyl-prolyl cis-trans isomerase [Nitrospirota bacterium]|nr:peptidyl-prolyl cis-trans isomerase [Nitrospirota bacterium]
MRKKWFVTAGALMLSLIAAVPGFSSDQNQAIPADKTGEMQNSGAPAAGAMVLIVKDPRSSTKVTIPLDSTEHDDLSVAVVNDVPITVEDLKEAIVASHEGGGQDDKGGIKAPKIDFNELLQRLINVQLFVQEARNIGLDELPEVKEPIDVFARVSLRNLLREDVAKSVKVNEDEVEKYYQESIREVKTNANFFEKEKDAKKAVREIKAGKNFDDVMAQAMKAGKIKGSETGQYVKFKDLNPMIAKAVTKMKVGSVSPVLKIVLQGNKTYFAVFRLDDDRKVESPEAKEQARRTVYQDNVNKAMEALKTSLYKKYAKVDKKLVESLDYAGAAGSGLEKFLNDQRTVVEIEGGEPITVAQLSEAMEDKFFHGMKNLKGEKMVRTKNEVLQGLVEKKLLLLEASRRGLDKTESYKKMVADYEQNTLWGAFIEKVVMKDVKLRDEDMRAYYRDHAGDYMTAEMVRIQSLAFGKEADAVTTLEKLRKGADFNWVKAHAEGQVDPNTPDLMTFGDIPVPMDVSMDLGLQKALSGVKTDDYRLYESEQGHFLVLHIMDVIPPQQQPFEQVQEGIRNKVFYAKLGEAANDWIRKLRESADIKVYLAGSEK